MNPHDLAWTAQHPLTQADHRAVKATYYLEAGRCTCSTDLPPDKDGTCLICRRPKEIA